MPVQIQPSLTTLYYMITAAIFMGGTLLLHTEAMPHQEFAQATQITSNRVFFKAGSKGQAAQSALIASSVYFEQTVARPTRSTNKPNSPCVHRFQNFFQTHLIDSRSV